jgi:hypothetical protein
MTDNIVPMKRVQAKTKTPADDNQTDPKKLKEKNAELQKQLDATRKDLKKAHEMIRAQRLSYEDKLRDLLRAEEEGLWEPALRHLLTLNPFNVFGTKLSDADDAALVVHVEPNFKSYAFRNGAMGIEQVRFDGPHKVLK